MLDRQLYEMVFASLRGDAAARGLTGYVFKQTYQPTQQARPVGPAVYLHKITDRRYGSQKVAYSDAAEITLRERTTQIVQTTLQASVTLPGDDPANAPLTHGDVLKTVAAMLQSPKFIKYILPFKAQVLRVQDIRNDHYRNDRNQWEPNPTFDFVISHVDEFIDGVPVVTAFDFNIARL